MTVFGQNETFWCCARNVFSRGAKTGPKPPRTTGEKVQSCFRKKTQDEPHKKIEKLAQKRKKIRSKNKKKPRAEGDRRNSGRFQVSPGDARRCPTVSDDARRWRLARPRLGGFSSRHRPTASDGARWLPTMPDHFRRRPTTPDDRARAKKFSRGATLSHREQKMHANLKVLREKTKKELKKNKK